MCVLQNLCALLSTHDGQSERLVTYVCKYVVGIPSRASRVAKEYILNYTASATIQALHSREFTALAFTRILCMHKHVVWGVGGVGY